MIEIEVKTRFAGPPSQQYDRITAFSTRLIEGSFKTIKQVTATRAETQKNHYFQPTTDLGSLRAALINFGFKPEDANQLDVHGYPASVRTRSIADITDVSKRNNRSILAVKQGKDSENGVIRTEIEALMDIPQALLDVHLGEIGLRPLSKWTRSRTVYSAEINKVEVTICLDENAGYGWLVEFEFKTESLSHSALNRLMNKVLEETGLEIIPSDLMDRMYAFYNEQWSNYYYSNAVFTDMEWEVIVAPLSVTLDVVPAVSVIEEEDFAPSISPDELTGIDNEPLENDVTSK